MKHLFTLLLFAFIAKTSLGQASWISPNPTDVTKKVRLYVDLDKTTNKSLDGNPGPFYIWTWKPFEHPVGDSLANGLGDKPWQNSNDLLQMTPDPSIGPRVYYYEMIPTKFYNVPASDVYSKGISFLVKPKNGGGYGAPDLKTEDLNVPVIPIITKDTIYTLPEICYQNEVTTIFYDNRIERNSSMLNLDSGNCYLWVKATDVNGNTYETAPFFQVQNNPKLSMKKEADGQFRITMVPEKFFNLPAGVQLKFMELTVRKKNYVNGSDQSAHKIKKFFGCI